MITIDSIPKLPELPKQEVVIDLETAKNAKFIHVGKSAKIKDTETWYALVERGASFDKSYSNKIESVKKELDSIKESQEKRAEILKKLGITDDELKLIIK
jgi:prefoldin subunit 5